MKLYRILLKPKSSIASEIQADTIFGAFAWSYKYIYGENKLLDLLEDYKNSKPKYIFSDCFPEDYFPRPLKLRQWECNTYDKFKKNKKIQLVHIDDFNNLINNIEFEEYRQQKFEYTYEMLHNSINRESTTTDSEQGGLYSIYETKYCGNVAVYVKCEEQDIQDLSKIMEAVFANGIGARRTTGKGIFEILSLEEYKRILQPEDGEYFVTLSTFIPSESHPLEGWYKTKVKYGKATGEFSNLPTSFKKPIVMFKSGSVFKDSLINEYYGTVIQDICLIKNVIQYGYTIPIMMK